MATRIGSLLLALGAAGLLVALPPHPAWAVTFTVNDRDDLADLDPSDGRCLTRNQTCTLRAAIVQANFLGGSHTVVVPAGTYKLKIPEAGDVNGFTGDLDIRGNLTILGAGATHTIIDGNRIDRVFEIAKTATVTIARVTIRKGRSKAGNFGGGILSQGVLTLDRVVVRDNDAAVSGGGVASIFNGAGSLTVLNSAFVGNVARNGDGGGIVNGLGQLTIAGSTINDNRATRHGAGVASFGPATIANSTISGNRAAGNGGGASAQNTAMRLVNVTLNRNRADHAGGAVAAVSPGTMTLKNSIVANSPSHANCPGTAGITSAGHNLDSGNTCGFAGPGDLRNIDPKVGGLTHNGGITKTHALLPGSPAIDAGDNDGCPATDQRGVARPQDGNFDGTAICDIGAYEATDEPIGRPQAAQADE
jgi:hypothetical protein